MKFLVLGVSGMAGHLIALRLHEQGHDIVGFSRRPVSFVSCIRGDVAEDAHLKQVIESGNYDVIINAIGILNTDAERNKALAVYLNAYLPHRLAELTQNLSTRVFHMSTDCVFAGNTGPYDEGSIPDGKTFYDRSKALGELNDEKNLTFRCSIVGPDLNRAGIGLLNWFMAQEQQASGYSHVMWTGLTTFELAKAMEYAAINPSAGLVNMVPNENISKFELLKLFDLYLRNDNIAINPTDTPKLDKTLVRTNWSCGFKPQSYRGQAQEMGDWVRSHTNLYPHYQISELT